MATDPTSTPSPDHRHETGCCSHHHKEHGSEAAAGHHEPHAHEGGCGAHAPGECCHHPHHAHEGEKAHASCCGHHHDDALAHAVEAQNRRFLHWLGCLALLFIGGVLIYAFTSGRIVHYLTGSGTFRVQCLIAGCGLLVLGAFNLFHRSAPEEECTHACDHDHDHGEAGCGHDHAHRGGTGHGEETSWVSAIVAFLILVVPLGAAVVYSPDRYSDEFTRGKVLAATTAGEGPVGAGGTDFAKEAARARETTPTSDRNPPANANAFTVEELERLSGGRTEAGNIRLRLDELYYMPSQTRDVQEVVAGEKIETIGQAINDRNDPTKMRIFQLMMSCCAADARPISIPVEFSGPLPTWREMAWYKLTGRVEYREINGASTTVFVADSLTPEKAPRTQLLY